VLAHRHVAGADGVGDQSFDAVASAGEPASCVAPDALDGDLEVVREARADGVRAGIDVPESRREIE